MIKQLAVCACVVFSATVFAQSTGGKKAARVALSTSSTEVRAGTDASTRSTSAGPFTLSVSRAGSTPGYKLKVETFYQLSAPSDHVAGPVGTPETGFARFVNEGTSTLTGTFRLKGVSRGGTLFETTFTSTLAPGASLGSISLNNESSNYGGFNKVAGGPDRGAEIRFDGTASNGAGGSIPVALSVFDGDVHSGSPRTNPFGRVCDSYVIQGGDPYGDDTGDPYELSQAHGFHTWTQAAAPDCTLPGTDVNFDVRISGLPAGVVSGYFGIKWNPSVMQLVSITPGDAPWTTIPLQTTVSGQASILCSIPATATPSAADAKVANLRFRPIVASCTGSNTDIMLYSPVLGIAFTDGNGSKHVPSRLVDSAKFVVDDTPPVFSGVQSRVDSLSCAGRPCGADSVGIVTPTATDGCAPVGTVPVNASRADGKAMSAAWPCGTTRVTWSAADLCGNTALAYTDVVVSTRTPAQIALAHEGASSYAASWDRCVIFKFTGLNGASPITSTVKSTTSFNGAGAGTASLEVEGYVPGYTCLLVEDGQHSLKSRLPLSIDGCSWKGSAKLVLGNITGPGNVRDDVIDVLDWGAYVVRHGLSVGSASCGTSGVHADLDGNGVVDSADGAIILANFGRSSDAPCMAFVGDIGASPIQSISVQELAQMGMSDLVAADLNGDGTLDGEDMRLFGQR